MAFTLSKFHKEIFTMLWLLLWFLSSTPWLGPSPFLEVPQLRSTHKFSSSSPTSISMCQWVSATKHCLYIAIPRSLFIHNHIPFGNIMYARMDESYVPHTFSCSFICSGLSPPLFSPPPFSVPYLHLLQHDPATCNARVWTHCIWWYTFQQPASRYPVSWLNHSSVHYLVLLIQCYIEITVVNPFQNRHYEHQWWSKCLIGWGVPCRHGTNQYLHRGLWCSGCRWQYPRHWYWPWPCHYQVNGNIW